MTGGYAGEPERTQKPLDGMHRGTSDVASIDAEVLEAIAYGGVVAPIKLLMMYEQRWFRAKRGEM